jgi:DNA helicase II / ATP-dependent DNA helicase PcrA
LVLSPRRHFGYMIRDELNARNVAAHSFFTEEIFDGDVTKKGDCKAAEAYTILCLLANPDDIPTLRVWLGLGAADLRRPAWEEVRAQCEAGKDTPRQVLDKVVAGTHKLAVHGTSQAKLVERYKELKARLDAVKDLAGADLFNALFPDGDEAFESLRSLVASMKPEWDAKKVFDAVSTFISQPEMPTHTDYVRVMSLHKSKGLTADCVVVTGCVEGALPKVDPELPIVDQERLTEEQRRLMYVAITRTRKLLMLSSVLTVPKALAFSMNMDLADIRGPDVSTQASRFLAELGPQAPSAILGHSLP